MPVTRRALHRFAAIFAAWTALGLLIAAQTQLQLDARGEERALWSVVAPALVGAWIWALYTPPLMILARRLRRLRENERSSWRGWTLFLAAHIAIAGVGTVVDAAAWAQVRPLIDGVALSFDRVFAAVLFMNVASYVTVVTLTEAADYAARWRERDRAATALARTADALRHKLNESRLRALEAQLRPHFLYNTLNLVAELVHEEPDAADEMLTHLGALLRRSYRESPQLVPLHEEMHFVRAYAEILARRYRDRVNLIISVPPELRQLRARTHRGDTVHPPGDDGPAHRAADTSRLRPHSPHGNRKHGAHRPAPATREWPIRGGARHRLAVARQPDVPGRSRRGRWGQTCIRDAATLRHL